MLKSRIEKAPSEEFFEERKKKIFEKIKSGLNILRPHEFEEAVYKIVGLCGTLVGLRMSEIAFLHPEEMVGVGGEPLTSMEDLIAKTLALCTTIGGAFVLSEGIKKAIKNVKIKEEIKKEFEKYKKI